MTCWCRRAALGPRAVVVLILVCAAGGGCASRFTAKNEYLAAGFTRESLRGRTVAVVPAPESDVAAAAAGELAGIALGMREAGARARLVAPPEPAGPASTSRPAGASAEAAPSPHTPRAD